MMTAEPHGPALIKAGASMGDVVEFYGVFIRGWLLPNRFRAYGDAEKFFNAKVAEAT